MEIRYITPEEASDYLRVSAASFIWKFDAKVDNSVDVPILAAFHEGKLIAGVEMFEFKSNYCGNFLDSLVVSGICSQPEFRRLGGVREIFNYIGNKAVENDWALGYLYPFSIEYYEKFGYANLNRMYSARVPFDGLRHIQRNTDVILYTGEQYEELRELHNKCALCENLMTQRNDPVHFCDKPLEESDYTYFRRNSAGVADGYCRFKVLRPNELVVEELFFLSPQALFGLIGFLRNYDGLVKTLVVKNQYQGSPFSCIADRITGATFDFTGGAAGRIYNVQKLLENNSYPDSYGGFRLDVKDEFSHNNGVFEVEYQNGKAQVNKIATSDYDISLTTAAASRILLAGEGHTAATACYINGVDLKNNADGFFRAFPHRPTRFLDSCISR